MYIVYNEFTSSATVQHFTPCSPEEYVYGYGRHKETPNWFMTWTRRLYCMSVYSYMFTFLYAFKESSATETEKSQQTDRQAGGGGTD